MDFAFLYPGQGSQSLGMGREFFDNFDCAKRAFATASEVLETDMNALCFAPNDALNITSNTQPAIFLVSYIANQIFSEEFGIVPKFSLGHSLGEISAFALNGGTSFENALLLTKARGEMMQETFSRGEACGMLAVIGLEDEVLEDYCASREGIYPANYNAPLQLVLAGYKDVLERAIDELKALGAKKVVPLPISIASHCPLLQGMLAEFRGLLQKYLQNDLKTPVISNATTEEYSTKDQALELLSRQLVEPVFYKQSIEKYQNRVDCFVEIGNGSVLKGLNRRITDKMTLNINGLADLKTFKEFIGE